MRLSRHARERWEQRCAGMDMNAEITGAKRASKAVLNRLRQSWDRSQGTGTWPGQHDYLVTPSGCLFIVCGEVVITVLLLRDIKIWRNRRMKDDRERKRCRAVL